MCQQWCRDTRTVTRMRHQLQDDQTLHNNPVTVQWRCAGCRASPYGTTVIPVTRECRSLGLKSPLLESARSCVCFKRDWSGTETKKLTATFCTPPTRNKIIVRPLFVRPFFPLSPCPHLPPQAFSPPQTSPLWDEEMQLSGARV